MSNTITSTSDAPTIPAMITASSMIGQQNSQTVLKPSDAVNSPSHYQFFPGVEAIEIIAASLTEEEFRGYCMGNRLKYRLRAGNKDSVEQDIAKSDKYLELFDKFKYLCR